jgi:parallel beta-helix repeat protein
MKQLPAIAGSLFMGTAVAIAGCGTESPTQPTTPTVPVRTIQQLLDGARSGDTIVVPPGVYHEHVRIDRTEHSNITLKGYGVILDGSGLPIPRDGIDIFSLTGVGLYLRGSGSQPPTGVVIEGFVVENFDVGIWAWGDRNQLRNVEARNNTRGFRNIGIWVGIGATLVDSVVHDNGRHGIMTSHTTTVQRTICTNNGVDDQNGAGMLVTGSDVQVLDNEVVGNPWGIDVRNASRTVVRGNRVHGNARAGIMLAGSGCGRHLVEDNDATFNGVLNVPPTFDFDLFDEDPQQRCHPDVYRNVWRNNRGKTNVL